MSLHGTPQDMGYFTGVMAGDGTVFKSRNRPSVYQFCLRATDPVFAEEFRSTVERLVQQKIPMRSYERGGNRQRIYDVRKQYKPLQEWYESLTESADTLRDFVLSDRETTIAFVRGFYDSDGSCDRGRRRARFTNTNGMFVGLLSDALNRLGIEHSIYGPKPRGKGKKPEYTVATLKVSHEKFYQLIQPTIKLPEDEVEEPPLCACGCGMPVTRNQNPPYQWNEYIDYHILNRINGKAN